MDKYDYVIEKPDLEEEFIAHFGIPRSVHKYIDKVMGKNGKWIYKYAKSAKNGINNGTNKVKTLQSETKNKIARMLPILSKRFNSLKKKTKSAYYRGKSKNAERNAWAARLHTGVRKTDTTERTRAIRTGYYNRYEAYGIKPGKGDPRGYSNSRSGQTGSKSVKTTKVNIKKKNRKSK